MHILLCSLSARWYYEKRQEVWRMSPPKSKKTPKKTVVVRMPQSHRVAVFALSAVLILCMWAALRYVFMLTELGSGVGLVLCIAGIIPFLPLPVYYASWKITFCANGIQKQLFGFKQKRCGWAQVEQVRCGWLSSQRNYVVCIVLQNGKTIRFRMDCENAENARKLILSHCSIRTHSPLNEGK